jgi:ATP-dependent DNA helicase DinG
VDRERFGRELRIAPLTVAGLLRELVLKDRTVVLTSATLTLGGDFDSIARQVGLRPADKLESDDDMPKLDDSAETGPLPWRGLDVGSPFEYEKQGILYVAKHLPPPHRDGLGQKQFDEIIDLITAAGGRTLGLFSSRRAAEAATAAVREATDLTILCQGDAQLGELAKEFVENPETSLFGTLSLWQGIDVPGSTCNLVIIDLRPWRGRDPRSPHRHPAVRRLPARLLASDVADGGS